MVKRGKWPFPERYYFSDVADIHRIVYSRRDEHRASKIFPKSTRFENRNFLDFSISRHFFYFTSEFVTNKLIIVYLKSCFV
jgi:hypothetical protein